MAASPNNTVVTAPGQIITDASGNRWQLSSGKVVVSGIVDNTTAGVGILAYENGKIWQMNTDRMWWGKIKPSDSWSPQYGTTVSPLISGFSPNMVVGVNRGGENFVIIDRNLDRWTITADGRVAVNGVADVTTGRVIALAYENGRLWQVNADGLWWSKGKSTDSWGPTYGTKTSPVPIVEELAPDFKSFTSGFVGNSIDSYVPAGSGYLTVDDGGKPVTFNYLGYNTADQFIRNAEESLIINVNGTLTLGGTLNTQGGIASATTTLNLEAGSTVRNLGLVSTTSILF